MLIVSVDQKRMAAAAALLLLRKRRCFRLLLPQQSRGIASSSRSHPSPAPRQPQFVDQLPPEKEEWWAVDGELFQAEKFDPRHVLAPLENEHIPNRKRRKDRIKHLALTRLKFRSHGQEAYWSAYMRRFQIMRNEWEKLVWDPTPAPKPKARNPLFVAEETEKYVWKDPRRDSYKMNNQQSSISRLGPKTAATVLNVNRYPFVQQRDAGPHMKQRADEIIQQQDKIRGQSHGIRNQSPQQQSNLSSESDEDELEGIEFSWDEDESECGTEDDESETSSEDENGHNQPLQCGSRTRRRTNDYAEIDTARNRNRPDEKSYNRQHLSSYSSEDDTEVFSTEDESGSDESDYTRERKSHSKKQGWHGHEDDLFVDSDSD